MKDIARAFIYYVHCSINKTLLTAYTQLPATTMRNTVVMLFFLWALTSPSFAQKVPDNPSNTLLEDASPEYIEESYQKALQNYSANKYTTSLRYIWHVLRSQPRNFNLRYLMAHNYWKLKDYPQAIKEFERCLRYQPLQASTYSDLSLLYMERKFYVSAGSISWQGIQTLRSQEKEIPTKLYNTLSRSFLHRGNATNALEAAQQAKSTFSQTNSRVKDQVEALILEARALQILKKFEKAEISLQWALSLKQGDPHVKNLLGYVYETWAMDLNSKQDKAVPLQNNVKEKIKKLQEQAREEYQDVLADLELTASLKRAAQRNLARLQQ